MKKVEIREIQIGDAEGLLEFFEKLVEADPERVERIEDVKAFDVQKEQEWIKHRLDTAQKQEMFALVAESEQGIVAEGEIERFKRWPERHVAEIRFGSLPGYEETALQMVNQLEKIAKNNNIELLLFFHFATAKSAIGIMRQAGFQQVGRISKYYKRGSEYIDRVYLAKNL